MAVAHVASATFASTTGTTGGTITIPTVSTGDDLYVLVCSRDHTAVTGYPTCTDNDTGGNTWTRIGSSTARKTNLYWKKATSATSAKTVTIAGAVGSCTGGLSAFRGALASGDPTTNLSIVENASGTETHASFTPTYADSMVCFGVVNATNDTLSVTSMSAATLGTLEPELWERLSTGGSDCYAIFTAKISTGGPTATGSITWAQTNSATNSLSFAIRPELLQTLTQSSTFTDSDTFHTPTVSVGAVALTQSAIFTDGDTFNTHHVINGVMTDIKQLALDDGWLAVYDPTDTPTVTLNGSNVAAIADGLGNLSDLAQGTSAAQPLLNDFAYGALTGVTNAEGDYLDTGTESLSQPLFYCFVMKLNETSDNYSTVDSGDTGNRTLLELTSGGNYRLYAGTVLDSAGSLANTSVHVVSALFNGASSYIRVDGTQVASGNAGSQTQPNIRVGANNQVTIDNFFKGDILPLCVYQGVIGTDARDRMEALLTELVNFQYLTASLFTNSATFHAPTVTSTYPLTPSLFADGDTFYTPTVTQAQDLTPSLFTNSATFFTPTVRQIFLVDRTAGTNIGDFTAGGGLAAAFDGAGEFIANVAGKASGTSGYVGKTLSGPKQFARARVYGSSNQGYVNAANPNVTLDIYGKAGTAPSSATDGTLLGTLTFADTADESAYREIDSTDFGTLWDHLWVRLSHDGASAAHGVAELELYELGQAQDLTPALFTNTNTFYTHTVTTGAVDLTPALYTNSATHYTHTVTTGAVDLTPALFTNSQTFYTHAIAAGTVTLTPDLFADGDTFYTQTVTVGSVGLTPSLFTNSAAFYTHTVTTGAVDLTPSLFTNSNSFYTHSISQTGANLTPSLFTNSQAFYDPAVTSNYDLAAALFENAATFYAPSITLDIAPSLFLNDSTFYQIIMSYWTPVSQGGSWSEVTPDGGTWTTSTPDSGTWSGASVDGGVWTPATQDPGTWSDA